MDTVIKKFFVKIIITFSLCISYSSMIQCVGTNADALFQQVLQRTSHVESVTPLFSGMFNSIEVKSNFYFVFSIIAWVYMLRKYANMKGEILLQVRDQVVDLTKPVEKHTQEMAGLQKCFREDFERLKLRLEKELTKQTNEVELQTGIISIIQEKVYSIAEKLITVSEYQKIFCQDYQSLFQSIYAFDNDLKELKDAGQKNNELCLKLNEDNDLIFNNYEELKLQNKDILFAQNKREQGFAKLEKSVENFSDSYQNCLKTAVVFGMLICRIVDVEKKESFSDIPVKKIENIFPKLNNRHFPSVNSNNPLKIKYKDVD